MTRVMRLPSTEPTTLAASVVASATDVVGAFVVVLRCEGRQQSLELGLAGDEDPVRMRRLLDLVAAVKKHCDETHGPPTDEDVATGVFVDAKTGQN